MTEWWANFHFLRPWLLVLLLIPLGTYVFYFRGVKAQSSWRSVIDERLLSYLLVQGSALKRRLLMWCALLGLTFAVIAAAGPSWQKIEMPLYGKQNPLMIVLNMSSDMQETDLTPTRLERAKYQIRDFVSWLTAAQIGMVVYSDEPYALTPLTDDGNIVLNLLPAMTDDIMPSNGDRLDRAIEFSVAKIQAAGYSTGRLLVMTPDVGQRLDLAIEQAKKAAASGFVVDVIGVSDRPNEKLQLVAEAGKGQYHSIKADEQWLENLASAISRHEGALMTEKNKRTVWLDAGWYFLGIPLLCCLLFFRKGLLVIMLLMSVEAQAGFFENSNQEALQAFNREDYDMAARRFSDRNWQAATAYRQGNYQRAYELYQQDNSSEGLYNQGNALAKGGKIDEAIAKYEEVLRSNPAHEDAKFNLEYLKQQQQQQQSSAQSQNQNDSNDNEQQSQQNKEKSSDKQNEGQQKQDNQQDSSAGEENSENRQSAEGSDSTAPQDANDNHNDDRADKDRQSPSEAELDETNEASEGKSEQGVVPQTDEENQEEYNEQMQAKAQQYRDIPEDAGGLLKAFIYQEYQKNRYNK